MRQELAHHLLLVPPGPGHLRQHLRWRRPQLEDDPGPAGRLDAGLPGHDQGDPVVGEGKAALVFPDVCRLNDALEGSKWGHEGREKKNTKTEAYYDWLCNSWQLGLRKYNSRTWEKRLDKNKRPLLAKHFVQSSHTYLAKKKDSVPTIFSLFRPADKFS